MARGAVKLMLALDGEDKLSAVIEKADRQMRNFSKSAKNTGKGATRNFATLQGTISNVGTRFTELNSKVMLLRSAFSALKSAGEFAISGEIANNAERIFSQVAGGADLAAGRMESLRKVSRGVVDDTTLQQFATKMAMAGADFNQTVQALALGAEVGLATGQDVKTAVDGMAKAAISGRATAFKMLGVTADLNKELDKEAKKTGRVREEMTAAEQIGIRLALAQDAIGHAMQKSGIDTAALSTKLRELKTDMENLESSAQQATAGMFSPNLLKPKAAAIEKIIKSTLKQTGQEIRDMATVFDPYEVRLSAFAEKMATLTGANIETIKEQVLETVRFGETLNKDLASSTDATARLAMALATLEHEHAREEIDKTRKAAIEADRLREAERTTLARNVAEIEAGIFAMEEDFQERLLTMSKEERRQSRLAIDLEKVALELTKKKVTERQAALQILKLENKAAAADQEAEKPKRQKALQALKKRRADTKKNALEIEKIETDAALRVLSKKKIFSQEEIASGKTVSKKLVEIERRAISEKAKIRDAANIKAEREQKDLNRQLEGLSLKQSDKERRIKIQGDAIEARRLETIKNRDLEIAKEASEAKIAVMAHETEKNRAFFDANAEMLEAFEDLQRQATQASIDVWADVGDAFSRPLDPLSQMIERSNGANKSLKILGATTAATAAATKTYAQEADATKSAQENVIKTAPAMISASGAAAAAFVKQTKTKALIQGSFETASAIAAFASGNLIGGVGHVAAATAFFALAGQGGGGVARATRSDRRQTALTSGGALGGGFQKSTAPIVVNVQGFAMGSAADLGTELGATISDARETGISSNRV